MKNFRLQMSDSRSPNWEFDDYYDNLEEVMERVTKTLYYWRNELQKFQVNITRSDEKKELK